jgi:MFS family permease
MARGRATSRHKSEVGLTSAITTSGVEATSATEIRLRLLVPTLVFVGLLVAVVSSLGAPLIPTIARADGVTLSTAQWVLTAALMTGAVVTPVMGRLADGPSQRRVIVITLCVVAIGCVVSALSGSFLVLVIGRGLQGMGMGLLPVNMATARRNLDPDKAGRAIATLSVSTAIGAGLGYPLTGLITETFDYRVAYWFGFAVVLSALACSFLVLPPRSEVAAPRFDVGGAVLLSIAVVGVSVLLSEGGTWGWSSALAIGIAVGCVALTAGWVRHELRIEHPLVDLRQVRRRPVLTADIAGFLMSLSMYLIIPIVVEFVQVPTSRGYGFGASVVVSGLVLVPLSAGTFLASRLLVVYERRFGVRSMIPLGALVFAAVSSFFAFEHRSLWEAFVTIGVSGLGMGFTFAAMPGFIVRAVPRAETGSATGFYQVLRNIGLSVGSALGAAVLLGYTRPHQIFPEVGGFHVALLISAGLGVVTAIVSFVLPGKAPAPAPLSAKRQVELEVAMEEEAELSGAGLMLTENVEPFGRAST